MPEQQSFNKKNGSLSSSHFSCLAGAISLALGTDVITQHGSQYEIFFRSEQVQGRVTIMRMASMHSALPKKRLMRSSSTG